MDLPEESIIDDNAPDIVVGEVSIGASTFLCSYVFEFHNCVACTGSVDIDVPAGRYDRFEATLGLTNESRQDNEIDGVVEYSIFAFSPDGQQRLMGPKKLSYGEQLPVNEPLSDDTFRLRLQVSDGTNYEFAAWGDARLLPAS